MEKKLKQAARKLLFELGTPVSSKGFNYAVEILCDGVANNKMIVSGSKVYANWGPVFGDTPTRTERALRFVKEECLLENNHKFQSIFGNVAAKDKFSVYEFLEMLRLHLLDEMDCNK